MTIKPAFDHLESAYRLHYYLAFKTHYLRPLFAGQEVRGVVTGSVEDVCSRHGYHLLDAQITDDHLRVLLSLKPEQTVSRVVQMLKGNLSRSFSLSFTELLARHRIKSHGLMAISLEPQAR